MMLRSCYQRVARSIGRLTRLGCQALLVLAGLATAAMAGEVHKWVDEEGNVHYSENPPEQSSQVKDSKTIDVRRSYEPTRRGDDLYCGEKVLPDLSDDTVRRIQHLEQTIRNDQEEIRELKQSKRERMANRTGYSVDSQVLRDYDREVAQLQCRIRWSRNKRRNLRAEERQIEKRFEELKQAVKEVKRRKKKDCGEFDQSGFVDVDQEYRRYRECTRPYEREIEKLEDRLDEAEDDYEVVEGY